MAFRTALYSLLLRNDLEPPAPGEPKSWSTIVGIQQPEAADIIRAYNTRKVRISSYLLFHKLMGHVSVPPSVSRTLYQLRQSH